MERGCARHSQARNSWNLKGSFLRTCTSLDSEESKLPRTWTCRRSRWKSGFKTEEWSTRRRAKLPKGAEHTTVASAHPLTRTIQDQRMRSRYLRPLLRKRNRCHPCERNSTPRVPQMALTLPCMLQLWVVATSEPKVSCMKFEKCLNCPWLNVYSCCSIKRNVTMDVCKVIWNHDPLCVIDWCVVLIGVHIFTSTFC